MPWPPPIAPAGELFHRSSAPEKRDASPQRDFPRKADRHPAAVDDDGRLPFTAGIGQHLLEPLRIGIDVEINGPVSIGCTSLVAEWSGVGPVNDDLVRHDLPPLSA